MTLRWKFERKNVLDLVRFSIAQYGFWWLISGLVDIIQAEFAERLQCSQSGLILWCLQTAARSMEHLRWIRVQRSQCKKIFMIATGKVIELNLQRNHTANCEWTGANAEEKTQKIPRNLVNPPNRAIDQWHEYRHVVVVTVSKSSFRQHYCYLVRFLMVIHQLFRRRPLFWPVNFD